MGMNLTDTLLKGYMGLAADYVKLFFFIFLTGAVFAAIMHKTGAAASIAEGMRLFQISCLSLRTK